jgi:aminopeptidase N
MARATGKPIDKIMASFIDQPGAPVITVRSTCSGGVTKVTLTQDRFYADRGPGFVSTAPATGKEEVWQIPVALRAAGTKTSVYKILTAHEQTYDLPGCAPWVFANASGRGYYRAEYGAEAFGKMSAEMETNFSPEERIHFLGDAWAMVRAGRVNIGDYLNAVISVASDRNREVINEAIGLIPRIHDEVAAPADRSAFEAWVRKVLGPITSDLEKEIPSRPPMSGDSVPGTPVPGMAMPDNGAERAALRTDVLNMLTSYGDDPALIAKTFDTVDAYMKDPSSVDAEQARNALHLVARKGDAALYDRYMEHLKSAKTPEEYYSYFYALASFRDPALTKRTIEFALSPAVRNQDLQLINALFASDETRSAAWDLFKLHFKELQAKAGADIGGGGGGFVGIAGVFCDAKMRDESQEFFAAQHLPGTERPLRNAKDRVNSCIALRSLQQNNLSEYLKK